MNKEVLVPHANHVVQDKIDEYRRAYRGETRIYTFSLNGMVQKEFITNNPPTKSELEEVLQEENFHGYTPEGEPTELTFDGVFSREQCLKASSALLTNLASQIWR